MDHKGPRKSVKTRVPSWYYQLKNKHVNKVIASKVKHLRKSFQTIFFNQETINHLQLEE